MIMMSEYKTKVDTNIIPVESEIKESLAQNITLQSDRNEETKPSLEPKISSKEKTKNKKSNKTKNKK